MDCVINADDGIMQWMDEFLSTSHSFVKFIFACNAKSIGRARYPMNFACLLRAILNLNVKLVA